MSSTRIRVALDLVGVVIFAALSVAPSFAAATESQLVSRELRSEKFANNKVGTSPIRKMVVYLPPGYNGSSKRYPVIYFLPDAFGSYRDLFDHKDAQGVFDRAIAGGVIDKFILVAVDMNTPLGSSWCVNSPATGNWEDFMIEELVPYIELPNWNLLANAKSLNDVKTDGYSTIFTTIFQAHLPNPYKPPLFIDLAAHKVGDQLIIDSKLTERLRSSFLLETMIPQYADNLKSLRGFKFDWGRNDLNQDHVYSNQAFTHKLNEFGIAHEAEEYNGTWGEENWGEDGRVSTEVLPFFSRHLVFDKK